MLFSTPVYADPPTIPYYSNNPIVAEVDGEPIYLDDLKHARIQEALVKLHQMQTLALKERLLGKLAKKHPEWYSEQDVYYAKKVRKQLRQEKQARKENELNDQGVH